MNRLPLRVAKIGGSLFDLDDLATTIAKWLTSCTPVPTVFLVGGGPAVDALRNRSERSWPTADVGIGDETAHWLAIEQMDRNACDIGKTCFPDWPVLSDLADWLDGQRKSCRAESAETRVAKSVDDDVAQVVSNRFDTCLFQPLDWLKSERMCDDELPRDWTVSSDSIAAHLASRIGATELVLLKSCGAAVQTIQNRNEKQTLVRRGWVDQHFANIELNEIKMTWVNLRDHDGD